MSLLFSSIFNEEYKERSSVEILVYVEFLVYFLTSFCTLLTRNMRSSPLRSSWLISSVTSYIAAEEYKQKSYVELLVYFLTDFIYLS